MRGIGDYIVVYDISDNRERRRVSNILKGFGFRVQKSVFECKMNKRYKKELIKKLERVELETGFVKIYRQEYISKGRVIGTNAPENVDGSSLFIV